MVFSNAFDLMRHESHVKWDNYRLWTMVFQQSEAFMDGQDQTLLDMIYL